MISEKILHIRKCIEEARKSESETHSLERYLDDKLPKLHHAIKLPETDQSKVMLRFLTSYIEHVPDFVEALTELVQKAGIYDQARVFLEIAEDYFIKPPNITHEHTGLRALIDEAYLAHRLIEEVNDQIMVDCGLPLAPIDMTVSNVVVHDLLGEEFANELDLAVHYSIEALDVLERWPCLASDATIELNLTNNFRDAFH